VGVADAAGVDARWRAAGDGTVADGIVVAVSRMARAVRDGVGVARTEALPEPIAREV